MPRSHGSPELERNKLAELSPVSIPDDIEYAVIEAFQHNKAMLATCCLVCRRWLPVSRLYLFRSMTMSSIDRRTIPDFVTFSTHKADITLMCGG
ncbi:hypothetical protein C8Q76DRAFT_413489 [Earliella scabrosa]|nr:hypothetical protein C8Q76DRAFT_413489 [Earliella scabrosa]